MSVSLEVKYEALLSKYEDLVDAHERVVKERDSLEETVADLKEDLAQADGLDEFKILAEARPFLRELRFRIENKTTGAWQSGPMLPDLIKLTDALDALTD